MPDRRDKRREGLGRKAAESHQAPAAGEYFLKPGYIYLSREPAVIYCVLGSCVAVCLWDRRQRIGGMNHFQYPQIPDRTQATARYGNVATLALVRLLLAEGTDRGTLEGQIFGGGSRGPGSPEAEIGRQNVSTAKEVLARQGIAVTSEDVGGTRGRKLIYNTETNEAVVLKVERLREEDWYPYRLETEGRPC
ncbi:MAG: chemotaxis protein CheD [Desulfobacterota bacterium]|nr:chemotaxis protein CheD [Thermodesulfobacteriota bacterium]